MHKTALRFIFFSIILISFGLQAQVRVQSELVNEDMMNLIRKEKFDLILPQLMQENEIDMWIHVMRDGDPNALAADLGTDSGVLVFTDRGAARIERAVLGFSSESIRNCGAYDIFLAEDELVEGDAGWENVIGKFVSERDPQRIGVNFSERYGVADGISHTLYLKLVAAVGDKYSQRMVSAENLIIAYLSARVMSEIVIYGQLCKISEQKIEKEFAKIVPGVTPLKAIDGNIWVRDRDGNEDNNNDYVIQRGDLIGLICGASSGTYSTTSPDWLMY